MNWKKSCQELANGMGQTLTVHPMGSCEDLMSLGTLPLGDGSHVSIFVLTAPTTRQRMEAINHMLMCHDGSSVILIPCDHSAKTFDATALIGKNISILPMGEHVIIDERGRVVIDGGPQALLADLKVQHGLKPDQEHAYCF